MALKGIINKGGSGGSPNFNSITSGTNTSATMVVGNGASLSATGTGSITANAVAANSTITTPNIIGIIDGSSAAAGSVGEIISATLAQGSAIALSAGVYADVISITLQGAFIINANGIMAVAASSSLQFPQFFIGTQAGNHSTGQDTAKTAYLPDNGSNSNSPSFSGVVSGYYVNPSTPTTYYLKAFTNFGAGITAFGSISANRIR